MGFKSKSKTAKKQKAEANLFRGGPLAPGANNPLEGLAPKDGGQGPGVFRGRPFEVFQWLFNGIKQGPGKESDWHKSRHQEPNNKLSLFEFHGVLLGPCSQPVWKDVQQRVWVSVGSVRQGHEDKGSLQFLQHPQGRLLPSKIAIFWFFSISSFLRVGKKGLGKEKKKLTTIGWVEYTG